MGRGGGGLKTIGNAFGASVPILGPTLTQAGVLSDKANKNIDADPGPGPKGRTPDLDPGALQKKRSSVGTGEAPAFLGLAAGMTPEQQRAYIATQGVGGGEGFNDPEALKYYNQIALNSLMDDSGAFTGEVLPVEKQFLSQLGYAPYEDSTQSYLSALDRALGAG